MIAETAEESTENVAQANEELKMAREYQKNTTNFYAIIFTTLTVLLWVWEWWNTQNIYR